MQLTWHDKKKIHKKKKNISILKRVHRKHLEREGSSKCECACDSQMDQLTEIWYFNARLGSY